MKSINPKRSTIACDNCHSRKTKCNGLQPCWFCLKTNRSCTYDRPALQKRHKKQSDEEQEAEASEYHRPPTPDNSPKIPRLSESTELEDEEFNNSQETDYIMVNPPPIVTQIAACDDNEEEENQETQEQIPIHLEQISTNMNCPLSNAVIEASRRPFNLKTTLINYFFSDRIYPTTFYLFGHDKHLEFKLHISSQPSLLIFAIYAYSSQYALAFGDFLVNGSENEEYLNKATNLIPVESSKPDSLVTAQSLLLLSMTTFLRGNLCASSLFLSIALRMARSLTFKSASVDNEMLIRLWWTMFLHDRSLASTKHQNLTIDEREVACMKMSISVPKLSLYNYASIPFGRFERDIDAQTIIAYHFYGKVIEYSVALHEKYQWYPSSDSAILECHESAYPAVRTSLLCIAEIVKFYEDQLYSGSMILTVSICRILLVYYESLLQISCPLLNEDTISLPNAVSLAELCPCKLSKLLTVKKLATFAHFLLNMPTQDDEPGNTGSTDNVFKLVPQSLVSVFYHGLLVCIIIKRAQEFPSSSEQLNDSYIELLLTSLHRLARYWSLAAKQLDIAKNLIGEIPSLQDIVSSVETSKDFYPLDINGCRNTSNVMLLGHQYDGDIDMLFEQ